MNRKLADRVGKVLETIMYLLPDKDAYMRFYDELHEEKTEGFDSLSKSSQKVIEDAEKLQAEAEDEGVPVYDILRAREVTA